MEVKVLGTVYDLQEIPKKDDPVLANNDGYCDTSVKKAIVDEMKESEPGMKENLPYYQKQVKRHEIIHAFLFESGLDTCCSWACEEMVDWLSIQFPKMKRAFEEVGCL